MDIELLMDCMGRAGVTILLKVDHERTAEGGKPWTLVLSGPGVGDRVLIRTDARTLDAGLEYVLTELQTCPGDWSWIDDVAT